MWLETEASLCFYNSGGGGGGGDDVTDVCSWGSRSIRTRIGHSWSRRSLVYMDIDHRRPHRPDLEYRSRDTDKVYSVDSRSIPHCTWHNNTTLIDCQFSYTAHNTGRSWQLLTFQ